MSDDRLSVTVLAGLPLIVTVILLVVVLTDSSDRSDMMAIVGLLTCVLCVLIGTVITLGYGGSVLAGWNTASDDERSKFDEKAIMRISGMMISGFGILVSLSLIGEDWFSGSFVVFFVLALVWMIVLLIYMNTSERFLSEKGKEEKSMRKSKI